MTVKITPNDRGNPPGKLADAELHFTGGPLEGLKLIGFSIWERSREGAPDATSHFRRGIAASTASAAVLPCCGRSPIRLREAVCAS